jgi:hypothetical protein
MGNRFIRKDDTMKITKEQVKDIAVRTLKTLLVVALVAFVAALKSSVTSFDAALISAGSAVGTVVLNVLIKLIKNFIDDWKLTAEELDDAFGGIDDDF